ncbi:MAG: efflux RND transporter periplasmic adaptor subunit [Deltaproteobacteria bacterium]|nr:efflux RND transporter periplasmic adaptor subunit [Deltaproteobacteria bacterium]
MKRKPGTIEPLSNQQDYGFKQVKAGAAISGFMLLVTLLTTLTLAIEATAAPAKEAGPPPLVTVVAVVEQEVNPPKEYVGHVEAIQTVDLQARVSGLLEKVNFKEGSKVRAGDSLYVIEQAPYQARVAVAKARVAKAQATLTRASNYQKRIKTVRTGGVSATDMESAEAAELEASAELQEAQANLTLAELDLGYTRILAPISGRIGATTLTVGNLCGPTSGPLARIVQIDPIRIQYSVSENDLSAIKTTLADSSSSQEKNLLRPQIRLPGGEVLKLSGHVDFVDNVVDASTGTITVRLVFDNPDGLLLPGQYVTVLVSRRQARLIPVIPQAAVLEDRDGRYVLVVDTQNQVEQRRISTGVINGTQWTVESGLTLGERVIVQGVQKVRPGQTVKTTSTDEAKGTD